MKTAEKVLAYVFFGFIILMLCFCIGWWSAYSFKLNIPLFCLTGLLAGVLLNCFLLRKIVGNLYSLNPVILIIVYTLYSIGIFGFFMGVPVFNMALGAVTGLFIGGKSRFNRNNTQEFCRQLKTAQIFTGAFLSLVCIASAFLALSDPYTPANLEGMLGLNFSVTRPMLIGIVVIGGLALLALQYMLTELIANFSYAGRFRLK